MKVIGLCGGTGSGKGIVCEAFLHYGIPSIDTDAVYHDMLSHRSECSVALASEFGASIMNPDGSVNRSKLRDVVFGANNAEAVATLNRITHSFILKKVDEIVATLESQGAAAVVVDAPLLFESGYDSRCDIVICVIADEQTRVSRVMQRDNISSSDVKKRIERQKNDEFLIANSDYAIYNNGTRDEAFTQVRNLIDNLNLREI